MMLLDFNKDCYILRNLIHFILCIQEHFSDCQKDPWYENKTKQNLKDTQTHTPQTHIDSCGIDYEGLS